MSRIGESELILNPDGSVYHLKLTPGELAENIIVVGDPGRVANVSKNFDRIELMRQNREMLTHTGYIGNKRLTVLSTGMGTDNIDIVLNELDAAWHFRGPAGRRSGRFSRCFHSWHWARRHALLL